MNRELLLQHFDRISEVPDAILRLRRFILDLAVRGKLVEQDPSEEPAAELLKRIQTEKARLVKKGIIKKSELSHINKGTEYPYTLPSSWEWNCLGNVCQYGVSEKVDSNAKISDDTWVLDLEDIEKETSLLINRSTSITRNFQSSKTVFKRDDVLFGKLRPYLNKVIVADTAGVCTTEIVPIRGYGGTLPEYIKLVLKSPLTMTRVDRLMYGMKMPRLGTNDAIILNIPLPPLAEQHRIVAKVDELMALCDQLQAERNKRESLRDRLEASSLNRISLTTAEEAKVATRFHLEHLPRLTTRTEHIKQLRQTILNLAVRGRLVQTTDSPRKPLLLSTVAKLQNGFAFKSEWFVQQGVRLLRNVNVSHGTLRWEELACLPKDRTNEFARFQLSEGDIVLSLDRPFITTGTKVARVCLQDLPCLLLQRVGRFQLEADRLCADYLFLWLHSSDFTNQIDPGRSNGVPHISSKQVESSLLLVPSLADQRRIVAKVDELMTLCDKLEARLTTTEADSRSLLEAVLRDALNPAIKEAA